ncbi:hypothetical protein Ccrd_024287, partial [Cynara cardunculus var. scolymus]
MFSVWLCNLQSIQLSLWLLSSSSIRCSVRLDVFF